MLNLLLATHNTHKASEIRSIFSDMPIRIVTLSDIQFLTDIEETGETFFANALLKATTLRDSFDGWILADDSGLEVDALEGRPGIHSARYAGDDRSSEALCQKLLKEMQNISEENRGAQFRTVMVLLPPLKRRGGRPREFEGVIRGQINLHMKGQNGFGYDPVFFVQELGLTMAEMTSVQKDSLSHRFRAATLVKKYLEGFVEL